MFSLENIETALPGVITKVGDGVVDCKTCIRKVAPNGVLDIVNLSIPKIPLMKLGGANAEFTFPSKAGDQVLLVALSRDSEKWKKGYPDDVVPDSSSGLTIADFVAVPFIASKKATGSAKIRVAEDGEIAFENASGAKIRIDKDGNVVFSPASGKKTIIESDALIKGKIQTTDDVVAGVTESGGTVVESTGVHLKTHMHPTAVGPTSAPTQGT